MKRDFRTAPIDAADRAMLEYVAQLSRDATVLGPENLDELRGHGFDDRAILQITLIASCFNYINRVADALGVGLENSRNRETEKPRNRETEKPRTARKAAAEIRLPPSFSSFSILEFSNSRVLDF